MCSSDLDVAMDAEVRRTRLKTLIILGKERGYLTYAEINDHLPDDTQDSEQIDGIIGLINDMGIQVYEEAPDAEVLLMSDAYLCIHRNIRFMLLELFGGVLYFFLFGWSGHAYFQLLNGCFAF